MVTHEDEVAQHTKRVIRLRDGLVQSDERNTTARPVSRLAFVSDCGLPQPHGGWTPPLTAFRSRLPGTACRHK